VKAFWTFLFLFAGGFFVFDVIESVHFSSLHNTGQTVFFALCAIVECLIVGFAAAMFSREF
jgi:hypothetical protein